MDPYEEKELEESLEFMRKQFQALTADIKVPDSLRADLLKKQLELMEAEQDERETRARRHSKRRRGGTVIPLRVVTGLAACFVVVGVSLLSYQLGRSRGAAGLEAPLAAQPSTAAHMDEAPEQAPVPMDADTGEAAPETAAIAPEAAETAPAPRGADDAPAEEGIPAPAMLQAPAPVEEETAEPEEPVARNTSGAEESVPAGGKARALVGEALPEAEQAAKAAADTAPDETPWDDHLPTELPDGLELAGESAGENGLSVSYLNEDYSRQIQLTLRDATEDMETNLADLSRPETYDLRLYTQPYTDSVPEELASTVNDPLFRLQDLTPALLEARVFDPSGGVQARGNFSVLFSDGTVAVLNVTGVSAREVYEMIQQMQG